MTVKEIRQLFPHLKKNLIYFNHAAIGPISSHVKKAIDNYVLGRSEFPVENFPDFLKADRTQKYVCRK